MIILCCSIKIESEGNVFGKCIKKTQKLLQIWKYWHLTVMPIKMQGALTQVST